jgi:peptidoglycan/xylan/chitin deacetylase (PgdA/CDA1 family)
MKSYLALLPVLALIPHAGCASSPETCDSEEGCDDSSLMNQAYEDATTDAKADGYDCSGVRVPDRSGFTKHVVLTFDDGPNPATTPKVISILHAHHAPATFFNNGARYSAAAKVLANQIAHDPDFMLGNHTQNHIDLAKQTAAKVTSEVMLTDALIKAAGSDAKYLRFPFGSASCSAKHYVEGLGYTVVGWHIDSADWCYAAGHGYCAPATFQYVTDSLRHDMVGFIMQQIHQNNGGVILMHDIHQSTADHLDEILTKLEGEGFTFARLDDVTVLPKLNGVATKFIGDACTANVDCNFTGGTCAPVGFCTEACTSTCPDESGKAPTFCIANPDDTAHGMCVSKSAPQNSSCAALPGTAAMTEPRFSDPNVTALVCTP